MPPLSPTTDPNRVARETAYTLTRDYPKFRLQAGDFLIVRPGHAPVIRRVITPGEVYELGYYEYLRVCYEDEADLNPNWEAPPPSRHLTLVR